MSSSVFFRLTGLLAFAALLLGCTGNTRPAAPPEAPAASPVVAEPPPIRIGLALGGGAAKGFAHIGVIKMLEANGFQPEIVAGTSAGSVVGAMYASGMDPFQMQRHAMTLDESRFRDVRLFSGGLVQGRALQDYVNEMVGRRPLERMPRRFAAVATRLEDGHRTVFVSGNTGQAVRASSAVPGVFEPVAIGEWQYVDGGVVSPVPVDAARELGAEFVIAVDISSKADGARPAHLLGIVNRSISIMGERLGAQELARADVVIRPGVNGIGASDFSQRDTAMLEGERAALAAIPQIRAGLERVRAERLAQARERAERAARQEREAATKAEAERAACEAPAWKRLVGRGERPAHCG